MIRPVPVKLLNYRERTKTVNRGSSAVEDQRFFRRFFMWDNISGVSSINSTALPVVIRYAKTVELQISIRKSPTNAIYPPLLVIDYGEQLTENIKNDFEKQKKNKVKKTSTAYPEVISIKNLNLFKSIYRLYLK